MFKPVELIENGLRVDIDYIGEGWSGDYDPEDPEDEPLVRFSCFKQEKGEWVELDDASYCTRVSKFEKQSVFEKLASAVMRELDRAASGGSNPKRAMEQMSWVTAEELKNI